MKALCIIESLVVILSLIVAPQVRQLILKLIIAGMAYNGSGFCPNLRTYILLDFFIEEFKLSTSNLFLNQKVR